ncbi:MAG: rhomboid family intramembrane serine protease, partial [Planctomycetota bacterium]
MPLIPIGTELRTRRPPYANWALMGLNVLLFLFTDIFGSDAGQRLKAAYALDAVRPQLHEYLTYQFLHGDVWHLLGNMLFLWIFGHPVCDRMGTLGYTFFYLAGGIFSGIAFTAASQNPIIGASGAIAAVTTAFLVLFPRVHVTMLVWMFFVFTFQVPAMILIVFKMVLWDNVIAPSFGHGAAENVAYSAHLGGYAFGFAVGMILLLVHALPRNQFDLIALWDRWLRRNLELPVPRARPVGPRPVVAEELDSRPLEMVPLTPVEQLREQIALQLAERDAAAAAAAYLRLIELDPEQVLGRAQQVEIANHLAQTRRYAEAARAYEAYLQAYPGSPDLPQVRLFLGLIYSRYLHAYERAVAHLRAALESLQLDAQRA